MNANDRWARLNLLPDLELKKAVFEILRAASLTLSVEKDDPLLLESVPRLAGLIESRPALESFRESLSALARATGLWNYIDKENADISDALVAETVTIPELDGVTLHREQISALNALLSGRNLILSAPTSFGKSLLIDALLASGKYRRVAIVLPTIALLDEFRRRLVRRFKNQFELIMHPSDRSSDGPTIFLGTQERLINRDDIGSIDLTVVDEFYKLDPNRRDERSVTLNAAVYKLLGRSRQFFFLGPNIDGVLVSPDGRWDFQFLRTRFSTVAVDTFDLRNVPNKQETLFDEIANDENWPALVFVSSPDKANKLSAQAAEDLAVSDTTNDFANWLEENVGPKWALAKSVRFGFGVHHGRIPRAIASHMVRLFNRGDIPVLFCTSTLIEGVNTAAKTVLIFDKEINRSNYDFFTFSNIRGRAGRLGQHHVGKVFLFNSPPAEEITEVAPTLFGDDDNAPDDYVVHLADERSNERDPRIEELKDTLELEGADLKIAASIGLENSLRIKAAVAGGLRQSARLSWTGYPDYKEIEAAVNVICSVKSASEFGARSAPQLTYFVHRLRVSRTIKGFLREYDEKFSGEPHSHDSIFKFLRSCEYGLTQAFAVVELFVKQHYRATDYSLFLRGLSTWFGPEELKNLDEEGIPIQISERFWRNGDDRSSLKARLLIALGDRASPLTSFERSWLRDALDIEQN